MDEYKKAHEEALKWDKNLILVGGSSFYLKSMIDGLSPLPNISDEVRLKAALMLQNLADTHAYLNSIDPQAMSKITPSDIYRIEKMLHIYLQTNTPPSQWFQMHPPTPIIQNCPVLTIQIDRSLLRERIFLRTQKMVKMGLIDEVAQLDRLYGRLPNSMNAIGLVETLEFLDGKYDKQTLIEEISTHTAQLAKRQQTFNAHQFVRTINASVQELEIIGRKILEENE
jgi:tRNA dimethylallyltransferase